MKILHTVEFYYPSIGGAQEVVRHLSEHMVKMGHDVTVATTKLPGRKKLTHNDVKIVEFDISGNHVRGIRGERQKYQEFLVNSSFDVVMNYAAQEWAADLFYDVIDNVKASKVLVPCGYSALYDPEYKKYFNKLPGILRKYDATVYMSRTYRDINFARKNRLKNIHIIPNGADEKIFDKSLSKKQKDQLKKEYGIKGLMIMTIANYTGEKGHDELLYVFKRLPITRATLVSAGSITPGIGCYDMFEAQAARINQSRKFAGKKVVMVDGSKREEVYNLLKCADIFVFLSNIEASPLVLFEAAAASVPFVASTAGNGVEIAQWTLAGLTVKSAQGANGRVVINLKHALWQLSRLAYNRRLRKRMGELGHKSWSKYYTWDKITRDYLKLYESLLKHKRNRK